MILTWLLVILLMGGVLAWVAGRFDPGLPRWIALGSSLTNFTLLLTFWTANPINPGTAVTTISNEESRCG